MRKKMLEDGLRRIAEQRRKEKKGDKLAMQRAQGLIERDKKDQEVEFGTTSSVDKID